MRSFRIATIRGIPVRLHVSFLLVLPLLAWLFSAILRQAAAFAEVPPEQVAGPAWLWGLALALALFLSVLLHELAHALYALRKGGAVADITLLMIGGVSRITRPPARNFDQGMMALVGPLSSVAIGLVFLLVWSLLAGSDSFNLRFAFFYLGYLNLFLAAFNLLPAFPMDGGRILRAVLVPRQGAYRATQTAAAVGKGFAILFGLAGLLLFNIFLLFIALFVWLGAKAEAQQAQVEFFVAGRKVHELMRPPPPVIRAEVTADEAAEEMIRSDQVALFVDDGTGVHQVLPLPAVKRVPPERRATLTAGQLAVRVETVAPDDELERALRGAAQSDIRVIPVVEEGTLVGMLVVRDVLRMIELASLHERERGRTGDRREVHP